MRCRGCAPRARFVGSWLARFPSRSSRRRVAGKAARTATGAAQPAAPRGRVRPVGLAAAVPAWRAVRRRATRAARAVEMSARAERTAELAAASPVMGRAAASATRGVMAAAWRLRRAAWAVLEQAQPVVRARPAVLAVLRAWPALAARVRALVARPARPEAQRGVARRVVVEPRVAPAAREEQPAAGMAPEARAFACQTSRPASATS